MFPMVFPMIFPFQCPFSLGISMDFPALSWGASFEDMSEEGAVWRVWSRSFTSPAGSQSSSPHGWPIKKKTCYRLLFWMLFCYWNRHGDLGIDLRKPLFLSETYSEAIRQTALDEIITVSGLGFVQKEWQKSRAKEQPSVDPQRTQKRINK